MTAARIVAVLVVLLKSHDIVPAVVDELEKLAETAVDNKYTETDEYRELRSVIDKANQCIKVALTDYIT